MSDQSEMTKDNISWSIYSDTSSDDVDDWVKENGVGYEHRIADIPDGIYEVHQYDYNSKSTFALETKVPVSNGKIHIDSSKEAVAEFLNKSGDWHYFIEGVEFGEKSTEVFDQSGNEVKTQRTLQFRLGS